MRKRAAAIDGRGDVEVLRDWSEVLAQQKDGDDVGEPWLIERLVCQPAEVFAARTWEAGHRLRLHHHADEQLKQGSFPKSAFWQGVGRQRDGKDDAHHFGEGHVDVFRKSGQRALLPGLAKFHQCAYAALSGYVRGGKL
jgi:hypothetical protein